MRPNRSPSTANPICLPPTRTRCAGSWRPCRPCAAGGGTDHGAALRRALAFHPDILYFLTDADDVSPDDVRTATRLNGRHTVIHAVEVSGAAPRPDGPLHKLAADNGGTYLRLDPDE